MSTIKTPEIQKDMLPVNEFTRPGRKLTSIKGVVVHWTGNPTGTAKGHAKYFHELSKQSPDDNKWDRYASAHYFVGLDGDVIQLIPDNEMAYHVGAKEYKDDVLDKFNTTYPNNCLIGVEMCHPDKSGEFTEITYKVTVNLVAYLLEKHDLTTTDIVRHYDVTGKVCPKWFVENDDDWQKFKGDVAKLMRTPASRLEKIKKMGMEVTWWRGGS